MATSRKKVPVPGTFPLEGVPGRLAYGPEPKTEFRQGTGNKGPDDFPVGDVFPEHCGIIGAHDVCGYPIRFTAVVVNGGGVPQEVSKI